MNNRFLGSAAPIGLIRSLAYRLLGAAMIVACGCSNTRNEQRDMTELHPIQSPEWYRRDHHDEGGGFRNLWGNDRETSFLRALPWLLRRAVTKREHVPPPARQIEPESLRVGRGELQIHWLGHATTFVRAGGRRILIDPIFSRRASPVSFAGPEREVPLPILLEDLPGVDVVLISHDHYDHLDKKSVQALEREFSPLFVVPLDLGDILRGWGVTRFLELDWWQYVDVDGIRYTCTPAQHFSGRGIHNRNGTLWAGWHLSLDPETGTSLFYAGDTGYAPHFREIRRKLGAPSIALIPIGAYLPRWFMSVVHMDPDEAIRAFEDLGAEHMIGVHWGTFDLADERLEEPARLIRELARRRGDADNIHVLDVGESITYGLNAGMGTRDATQSGPGGATP